MLIYISDVFQHVNGGDHHSFWVWAGLDSTPGKLMLAMLAAIAAMARDLIVERAQAGLARAKAEGKVLGRPAKTTPEQRKAMIAAYQKKASVSALAR